MGPELLRLIQTRFREEATLQQALALIEQGGGIARCAGAVCAGAAAASQRGASPERTAPGLRGGLYTMPSFSSGSRRWRSRLIMAVAHALSRAAPCACAPCRARALAREEGQKAVAALACLPETPAKKSLELMVDYVLERLY